MGACSPAAGCLTRLPAPTSSPAASPVPPDQVASAESMDAATTGPGWTCFGGTGLDPVESLDDAPWLGAWAPGGGESVHQKGYGVRLAPGSRIVMQVHYNLLAGTDEDVSAAQLRLLRPRRLTELRTMLMPAPVELPCREAHDDGPLCDRDAAIADVKERFGRPVAPRTASTSCAAAARGPATSSRAPAPCPSRATLRGVAGHMHLLGRSIKIEVNPGTDRARDHPRHSGVGLRQPGRQAGAGLPARRRTTRSRSPAGTCSGCATSCRRSRGSPTGTSFGARARPTRCAWASCRSPGPDPSSAVFGGRRARSRSMEALTSPTGRTAPPGIHD